MTKAGEAIIEGMKEAAELTSLAAELCHRDGYTDLMSPSKETRNWYFRMAQAILQDREGRS